MTHVVQFSFSVSVAATARVRKFALSSHKDGFSKADDHCITLGKRLARLEIEVDLNAIVTLMQQEKVKQAWVALQKKAMFSFDESGGCQVLNNSNDTFSYLYWTVGEEAVHSLPVPSYDWRFLDCDELCFSLYVTLQHVTLKDKDCTKKLLAVCVGKE